MTDDERAEVVRRGVAAWNNDDLDTMLELLDPDVELRLAGAFLGLKREYHGLDGYREFWTEFRDMWEKIEIGLDGIEHFPTAVVVDSRFAVTGRDGMEVNMATFAAINLPGDKVAAWSNFTDRERAVKAARAFAGQKTGRSA